MENQSQQPVMPPANDFLSRMDMADMPPEPIEPKKKLSTGMIIGIVAGALAVIGIVVGIIMMMSPGETKPTPTVAPTDFPDEPEVDEEIAKRNKPRMHDLDVVKKAVNAYQATKEANGQLPGPEVDEWTAMLKRFAPEGVTDGYDDSAYTVGAVCKFGEECVDISSLSWEENQHQIYVLYNADCKGKHKENVIVSSTRLRRVAIFAIIEGDEFLCTTNGE